MRKLHKEQILDLLKSFDKATDEIKRLFLSKQIPSVTNLLADCQDGAVNIAGFIEQAHGEGTKTVQLLNEFCEMLYKASVEVTSENANDSFVEQLKKQISAVRNSINSDLKPKIEIAFFPYKASMWDALESIYLAAKEDPDCDAYVIPIPYFDRNRDDSLGQEHYEISDYPKNIPLADYHKYNLEERRPDMIFIHNPYDGQNTVTSVHPDYYSDKLKNFTNCLVYVPYFTHRFNVNPDLKMPNDYFWAPIFFNAHKIISQTEQWKKYYADGFKRMFGQRFGNADSKFLALGNPKIDKVVNSKPEDFEIPLEWKRIIENPDGSKKRVILYNTSIAAILNGNEEYLTKFEYVLDEIKKQNNVALLFRPHPLSITTYQTMRSMLLNRYLSIVEKYKAEKYGIYDESPDLHRAIALSDAYFGDDSSVAALYGFTGKPIMFQSLNLEEIQSRIAIYSFFKDSKDNIWTWHHNFNALFKLDIESNKVEFITYCEKKEFISGALFCKILETNGNLLCFPYYSDCILEFNPQTMEKKYIQLDIKHKINSLGFCITEVLEYKGDYYCFGLFSDSVIILRKDGSVDYDSQIYKQINLKSKIGYTKYPVYASSIDENGNVTVLFYETDSIFKYNLPNQKLTKIFSNKRFEKIVNCICDGKYIWATTVEPQSLLKIDLEKNSISEFKNFPENFKHGIQNFASYDYLCIADCCDYLLLLPYLSSAILRFDKKSEVFGEYKDMPVPVDWTCSRPKYTKPFKIGSEIFVPTHFNRILYELNIDTDKISEHSFELDEEIYNKHIKGNFWNLEPEIKPEQFYAKEENLVNVFHEFIENSPKEVERQKEAFGSLVANSDGTSGKNIYETLKKFILPK